jgi:hypothetical protein
VTNVYLQKASLTSSPLLVNCIVGKDQFNPILARASDETSLILKFINFYINLLNLLNCFEGGIGKNMRKAAHPLGGVGSSNPRHWRGERLHHHGDGVC